MINVYQKKKAFTLVEITVSLFIITILVSLVVANYRVGNRATNINNSQASVYQNLKLAQSQALSFRSYNNVLPEYWGLNFSVSSSSIILFADLNGNFLYDSGESDSAYGGREISLGQNIVFNIKPNTSELNVLFSTTNGEMTIFDFDANAIDDNEWHIEFRDLNIDFGKLIVLDPPSKLDILDCFCNDINTYCCSFCLSTTSCNYFNP